MSDEEPSLSFDPAPQKAGATPYRVLARKYRPSDFSGLVGQEALVKTLSNAFATGRIAHAFMLTGVRGVGKTTTARIIARALNCIGPDGTRKEPTIHPCGVCEPCVAIAESRHVDVQEMDAASNNGVDEVRQIIDSVRYAPASARYKVYILDEVHMLSKPAFNAILKTLEEPPPHVKFIFATTEIRKVPVTILSRCQRFDLRRIETDELVGLLGSISEKENVAIARDALALIARAAEGSARDGLSLLDQTVAHGEEGGEITADAIRGMLGLADRGRVLDLFEKVMAGKVADALADLNALYDHGADPLAVMQDLLEIVHFLTRVKVAPGSQSFFDGGSGEAKRAAEMAGKLSVPSLTRAWQMLLKGLLEVRDATRPVAACEMALIRLAYAADLPPTDKLVRDLLDNPSPSKPSVSSTGREGRDEGALARATMATTSPVPAAATRAKPAPEPTMSVAPKVELRTLQDLAALAHANGAPVLKVNIENNMRLVRLEPGVIEFTPTPAAPRTLAGDLSQKLKDWTGVRWSVSIVQGGAPTLAEQKHAARTAKFESVTQEPLVRAVLDRFPGAEIKEVRALAEEEAITEAMPDKDD
ncbi:MAG: DNA polymerase III subunit gamma/tau [Alphaproteobacteria bacterium]|nr:DNA polymerase III subunit gamma/tau [Alphaproteobacteria bacterium]MBL7098886.1 DNA polymerase III subunit gamma/tau [Alphaproteobacteria bacterium]